MAAQTPGLKLFNTLTGQLEDFTPLDPAGRQVKMYVCGPTVYDDAHLGHARCYITWDVLYRFLKFLGYDVKYVRNVTDVDDKILNRAAERGEAPAELAERNYQSFTADMKALNVLPPDEEPRATEYIPQMLAGIQALIEKGAAYPTADGSVYFRVAAKPDYGKLKFGTQNVDALKKHLEDLKSGARVEVDEVKESPLDFALWKAVSLDDPNGWESPWPAEGAAKGWGRPGWHMECSAMNHAVFGDQIDIHAGGADLIFPHHENEIAQSEAWSGLKGDDAQSRFAKYWLHNGFVNVSGEKMSKSLGNFSTIKKLLERYDANTIRHFLLNQRYSMPVDFNDEALKASENWVMTRHKALKMICEILKIDALELQTLVVKDPLMLDTLGFENLKALILYMCEDLNTPRALGALNGALADLRDEYKEGRLNTLKSKLIECISVFSLLGFDLTLIFEVKEAEIPSGQVKIFVEKLQDNIDFFDDVAVIEEKIFSILELNDFSLSKIETIVLVPLLESLLTERQQAKATKNWIKADSIRQQITDIGLQLLDNKDGTTTVEKDGLEILRV